MTYNVQPQKNSHTFYTWTTYTPHNSSNHKQLKCILNRHPELVFFLHHFEYSWYGLWWYLFSNFGVGSPCDESRWHGEDRPRPALYTKWGTDVGPGSRMLRLALIMRHRLPLPPPLFPPPPLPPLTPQSRCGLVTIQSHQPAVLYKSHNSYISLLVLYNITKACSLVLGCFCLFVYNVYQCISKSWFHINLKALSDISLGYMTSPQKLLSIPSTVKWAVYIQVGG